MSGRGREGDGLLWPLWHQLDTVPTLKELSKHWAPKPLGDPRLDAGEVFSLSLVRTGNTGFGCTLVFLLLLLGVVTKE